MTTLENQPKNKEADFTKLAAEIVCAYVAHNSLPAAEVPNFMASIHKAITSFQSGAAEAVPEPVQTPAVSVKKSVQPDFIVCLDDGKKFKSLKRHLGSLGMTPEAYRAKWGLPVDYPMVAPAYAAMRSELAKKIGLGSQGATSRARAKAASSAAKSGRGRPRKAA